MRAWGYGFTMLGVLAFMSGVVLNQQEAPYELEKKREKEAQKRA